jgi:nucleotide-binding universal stress UspA family protein
MTILVATDGSAAAKAAVRLACELARATGDELLVVTVWNELRGDFGVPLGKVVPGLIDIEREHAAEVLAEARQAAEAAGIAAETLSRHGEAADEICLAARERNPRMIVIGTHGQGLVERAVFGSVAQKVVHLAPCPVLLVPGREEVVAGAYG